jgi:ATP synthase, subunit F
LESYKKVRFMKMYVVSDNTDTLTGLRLAGVDGVIARNLTELKSSIEHALTDKEIGIILLMESFQKQYPDYINSIKLKYKTPLFVDIPDRHGSGRKPNFITDYVNEAIGLKL